MKKRILLVVVPVVIALLLVIFGRDFLDLYRLQNYVANSSKAYLADGGAWPHLTDVCMGCHGVKGNSLAQGYPSLAGQPAPYVTAQLRNFVSGQRSDRNMAPLAMTLGASEIKLVADYYAQQSPVENRYFHPDPHLQVKGEQLVKASACVACHGAALMGHDQFPRLAGQGYDYLVKQLNAFADGARTEPTGTMKSLAAAMSPEDRAAVASYLASLKPDTK
ncbi:c-type cytochrome [Paraburkholderia sp. A1RI-2L]|uniref:c-type cytochrome n=1 Tax=Paraburkholderia sp. A1RI-2L TaxID=3028367 RepID=UPI003B76FC7E